MIIQQILYVYMGEDRGGLLLYVYMGKIGAACYFWMALYIHVPINIRATFFQNMDKFM